MTFTQFPNPDPKAVGFAAAARAGNADAVRVAADKLRDAGRASAGMQLDILAGEIASRCLQAQHLRAVLAAAGTPRPVNSRYYPKMGDMRPFVERSGLWVDLGQVTPTRILRNAFVIIMPTDGREVPETAAALGKFLGAAFPDSQFMIFAHNSPMTDVGREAMDILEALDAAGGRIEEEEVEEAEEEEEAPK